MASDLVTARGDGLEVRTKKVPRTSNCSNKASSLRVFPNTRDSRESQLSRRMLGANADT